MQSNVDPAAVDVRRGEIDAGGSTCDGWVTIYDGTEAVSISREGALKRLVIAVAQEEPL